MNKIIAETMHNQRIEITGDNEEHISDVIDTYVIPLLLALGYHPHSVERYIQSDNGSFYDGWEKTKEEPKELETEWEEL